MNCFVQIVKRNLFDVARIFKAFKFLPFAGDLAGNTFGICYLERVACIGHTFKPENFYRHTGLGGVYFFALVVKNSPHPSGINTGNIRIARS